MRKLVIVVVLEEDGEEERTFYETFKLKLYAYCKRRIHQRSSELDGKICLDEE